MSIPLNFFRLAGFCLLLLPGLVTAEQVCNPDITATTSHLVDNNNGIISDPKTGLEWKKCSEGLTFESGTNTCDDTAPTADKEFTWQAALQRAQAVNAGTAGEKLGQADWRVPNIRELRSIVERSCFSPAINITVFPATLIIRYWSSSSYASSSSNAFNIVFNFGDDGVKGKLDNYPVRLVRSGQ